MYYQAKAVTRVIKPDFNSEETELFNRFFYLLNFGSITKLD